jgi:hypothetical protein
VSNRVQGPGNDTPPHEEHEGDEGSNLGEGERKNAETEPCRERIKARCVALTVQGAGERRQEHEGENHDKVFDDKPADGDATTLGFDEATFLKRAKKNHGARDRKCQAENKACLNRPAEPPPETKSHQCCDRDLADRARDGGRSDGQQILEREMKSDAKHEQNDADLGQLWCQLGIGDVAGRRRSDQHARQQITDQGRHAQKVR